MRRRVVVTGLGAISPLGFTAPELWEGLLEGRSGTGPVTRFDTKDLPTKIAAEIKNYDPLQYFDRKELRHLDLYQQYALIAAKEALEDSRILSDGYDSERTGVIIGSSIGGVTTLIGQYEVLRERGPGRVSPYLMPMMVTNMAAGFVAIKYKFMGPNFATVSACAGGAHAIGEAFRSIQLDEADVFVAGGSEATTFRYAFAGFCIVKAMSTRNDEPGKASRPFDKNRDGFVLGEGSGLMILEELERARSRGAKIYAEVVGYGKSADAYHMLAPEPEGKGAALAMKMALKDAGIKPEQVDYINAHGTATPLGDISETIGIKSVFGEHAYKLTINSSKSAIGHLLGGAGGIESVITALSIRDNKIHPTINYQTPDPECDLDCSPNHVTERRINYALSNSLGFGGHNAVLVFKKYTG
ncbi:MAG: beta-ketoacyl-[acyl-carrier-protein] synthase II [candidate division Zixibacteria bacterium CG_4_9_14_3_um_filter_46_8]|nr:MAG: beta-ketoacyl-[acyl-carrier-protein] synthase II [candidate division Zixibacteria bacterium CG_4_9_14_3_um_filter_46_8]